MQYFTLSDVELCWLHGFKAFHQRHAETTNPYTPGTKQAHYWCEGWWEAFFNTDSLSSAYEQYYQSSQVETLVG